MKQEHKKFLPHAAAISLFVLQHISDVTAVTAPREGEVHHAYLDDGKVVSICDGHTGQDVHLGMVATHPQCMRWLNQDEMKAAMFVAEKLGPGTPYSVWIEESDFAFNVGTGRYATSSVYRLSHAGNYSAGCAAMMQFDKIRVIGARYDHRILPAAEYQRYLANPGAYDPPGAHLVADKGLVNRRKAAVADCLKDVD